MSGAERQRRRRRREGAGLAIWPIEVHENATCEALYLANFLPLDKTTDHQARVAALTRLVQAWVHVQLKTVTRDCEAVCRRSMLCKIRARNSQWCRGSTPR
jgi:hypothetical protein